MPFTSPSILRVAWQLTVPSPVTEAVASMACSPSASMLPRDALASAAFVQLPVRMTVPEEEDCAATSVAVISLALMLLPPSACACRSGK